MCIGYHNFSVTKIRPQNLMVAYSDFSFFYESWVPWLESVW